jgi:predicted kinase
MKKLPLAVLCVLMGLAQVTFIGCTSLSGSLLQRSAAKPDQAVVESFIRMRDEMGAREYLIRFGVPETEVIARIQQAKESVAGDIYRRQWEELKKQQAAPSESSAPAEGPSTTEPNENKEASNQ